MPTINQLIRHGREKQAGEKVQGSAYGQKPPEEGRLSVGYHDFP